MNSRVTAILVLALLISGGATYLVYRVVAAKTAQASATGTTPVVMAAHDIMVGALIKDADLKTAPWAGTVPKGVVVKKEAIIGRGVIAPIWEGQPIIDKNLAAEGAGGGLAATIPPGMRAVAVRVNDIVGVAGFVVPGMKVDVLISGTPPGPQGPNGPKVKTLLQNIQVLSAGQNYQKDVEGKPVVVPVVNLLVTPEQAEVLSLASNETRIQLVLRNPMDPESPKTPGIAMSTLFGDTKPAVVVAGPPRVRPVAAAVAAPVKLPAPEPPKVVVVPVYHIEVINGAQRSEAKFTHPVEAKQ
jgi:pilus assembly protein CpaB